MLKLKPAIRRVISVILSLHLLFLTSCGQITGYYFQEPSSAVLPETAAQDSPSGSSTQPIPSGETYQSGNAEVIVHVIDVGQGLGVLVEYASSEGSEYVLIDGGPADHTRNLVAYMSKAGVKNLNSIIVTHYHADHINGSLAALKTFGLIGSTKIYSPSYSVNNRSIYTKWKTAALSYPESSPVPFEDFFIGDMRISFIHSGKGEYGEYTEENDNSIGVLIQYGDTSMICLGDMEIESEYDTMDMCINNGIDVSADIYIANHHGSSSSSSEYLLNCITKTDVTHYCAISCGKNNDYGHPHSQVIERLAQYGYVVSVTAESGDLVYHMDGVNAWLE